MALSISATIRSAQLFAGEGDSLTDVQRIIADLEQQRDAIDRAIVALREIAPSGAQTKRSGASTGPTKRQMSPEGRQRIVEALKKRWAAKRAAQPGTTTKRAAQKKIGRKAPSRRTVTKKQAVTGTAT